MASLFDALFTRPEPMQLPTIAKGDVVMVIQASAPPSLFRSDGRVAQSDLQVSPQWATAIADTLAGEQLYDGAKLIVDEAVRREYLKDYVQVFGRTTGFSEYDMILVGSCAPYVFFGAEPAARYELKLSMCDRVLTQSTHNPHVLTRDYREFFPAVRMLEIAVGEEAICEAVSKHLQLRKL